MATKKMMRILAGMAIAPLCGAIVATLSCAPSDVGNGGNSDRGDTLCPNKADCPEITDGGMPDAGTPDGGNRLDVVLLRAVFNGRYAFVDPQSGNTKTTNVEVKVCNTIHYPQTEVCLHSSWDRGDRGILPDWSLMSCRLPLTADGKCTEDYWDQGRPYLCDCKALTELSGAAAGAECERRKDPPREECDSGGGVVIDFVNCCSHCAADGGRECGSIPSWKYMQ